MRKTVLLKFRCASSLNIEVLFTFFTNSIDKFDTKETDKSDYNRNNTIDNIFFEEFDQNIICYYFISMNRFFLNNKSEAF
jgi:hypothetical protein